MKRKDQIEFSEKMAAAGIVAVILIIVVLALTNTL
jgi:hypothetical protein